MFNFGIIFTILWVALIAVLVSSKQLDWLPLFMKGEQHLELNEIGDTLGGMFAPLAFLWLFIATWLQKSELNLQRRELEETRKVLDAQMAEMRRSADESNTQTEIMNQTLSATLSRDIYDSFGLKLYYLALWLVSPQGNCRIYLKDKNLTPGYQVDIPAFSQLEIHNRDADLDKVFMAMLDSLNSFVADGFSVDNTSEQRYRADNERAKIKLIIFSRSLEEILDDKNYQGNAIIDARRDGLLLPVIVSKTKQAIDLIEKSVAS